MSDHPIGAAVRAAASGRFPPVDGRYEVVAPWRDDLAAVVAFTGHALVAAPADHGLDLVALGADGFGGAHHPAIALALAGPGGWVDSLDLVLVAAGRGAGRPALVERPDLVSHPRAIYNAGLRDDLQVFGRPTGGAIVTLGRGLGGLLELGIETNGGGVGGRELLADALTLIPPDDVVVAAVAPGNARAVRTFLAAGFDPVGSVQLVRRQLD